MQEFYFNSYFIRFQQDKALEGKWGVELGANHHLLADLPASLSTYLYPWKASLPWLHNSWEGSGQALLRAKVCKGLI